MDIQYGKPICLRHNDIEALKTPCLNLLLQFLNFLVQLTDMRFQMVSRKVLIGSSFLRFVALRILYVPDVVLDLFVYLFQTVNLVIPNITRGR